MFTTTSLARVRTIPTLTASVLALLFACGTENPLCEPGAVRACTCASGASGEQSCSVGGAAYGTCHCDAPPSDAGVGESDGGGAMSDGGATPSDGGAAPSDGGAAPTDAGGSPDATVESCASSPCQNGGTCAPSAAGFTCTCAPDFVGERCESHVLEVAPIYYLSRADTTWAQAGQLAAATSGHLMAITTPAAEALVRRIARTTPRQIWVGGYQDRSAPDYAEPVGGWRWTTGEPFTYSGWAPGEPSGGADDNLMVWGTGGPYPIGSGNDSDASLACHAILQISSVRATRDPRTDHFYANVVSPGASWRGAADAAASFWLGGMRGHLLTIESAAEQQFVEGAFGGRGNSLWLGAHQDHAELPYAEPLGGWRWVTGEELGYAHWAPGQPDFVGESGMAMSEDGLWFDTDAPAADRQFVVEFEPATRIDYVGQEDDITHFRDGQRPYDADDDGLYGTAGFVFYTMGVGPPGGPLEWEQAAPLTYNQHGFTTLRREPSFATFQSAGQDFVAGGAAFPMIDYPYGTPGSGRPRVQSGLAVHNRTSSQTRYASLMTLTITAPPPRSFRVGVAIAGDGEDRMARVQLLQTSGGVAVGVGETAGRPATLFHFFDIEGAEVGDTFLLSAEKGDDSGLNPNAAYIGVVVDGG